MSDDAWVLVPKKLTFGMRVALEEAILRHEHDPGKIYSELLDVAPTPPRKEDDD